MGFISYMYIAFFTQALCNSILTELSGEGQFHQPQSCQCKAVHPCQRGPGGYHSPAGGGGDEMKRRAMEEGGTGRDEEGDGEE